MTSEPSAVRNEPQHVRRRVGLAGLAERGKVGDHVGHRQHRVQHRHVYVLALSGHITLPQGREHADHRKQSGGDVAQGADRIDVQRFVAVAFELVDAGHAFHDGCIRRSGAVGAGRVAAEARHRHQHRTWVGIGQHLRSETEAVKCARFEIFGDHVGVGGQLEHQPSTGRRLEVDTNRVLAQVGTEERGANRSPLRVGDGRL